MPISSLDRFGRFGKPKLTQLVCSLNYINELFSLSLRDFVVVVNVTTFHQFGDKTKYIVTGAGPHARRYWERCPIQN